MLLILKETEQIERIDTRGEVGLFSNQAGGPQRYLFRLKVDSLKKIKIRGLDKRNKEQMCTFISAVEQNPEGA